MPLRVLIIDDDPHCRDKLAWILRAKGIEVVTADNVCSARSKLSGHDRIITDLNLGDGSGLTLLREAHNVCPQTRLAVMSGEDDIGDAVRLAERVFAKPFNLPDMLTWLGTPAPGHAA